MTFKDKFLWEVKTVVLVIFRQKESKGTLKKKIAKKKL